MTSHEHKVMETIASDVWENGDGFFYKEIFVRGKESLPDLDENTIFDWAVGWAMDWMTR